MLLSRLLLIFFFVVVVRSEAERRAEQECRANSARHKPRNTALSTRKHSNLLPGPRRATARRGAVKGRSLYF